MVQSVAARSLSQRESGLLFARTEGNGFRAAPLRGPPRRESVRLATRHRRNAKDHLRSSSPAWLSTPQSFALGLGAFRLGPGNPLPFGLPSRNPSRTSEADAHEELASIVGREGFASGLKADQTPERTSNRTGSSSLCFLPIGPVGVPISHCNGYEGRRK